LIIQADAEKISQVINNLIDNAIKFSQKGGMIGFHLYGGVYGFAIKDRSASRKQRSWQFIKCNRKGGRERRLGLASQQVVHHGGTLQEPEKYK
jgi:K+-sensing histidine kinase KdpD